MFLGPVTFRLYIFQLQEGQTLWTKVRPTFLLTLILVKTPPVSSIEDRAKTIAVSYEELRSGSLTCVQRW